MRGPGPATVLEEAAAALRAGMRAAEPKEAAALAIKLTAVLRELQAARQREAEENPQDLAAQRRAFDREVERLIALRVEERVEDEIARRMAGGGDQSPDEN